MTSEVLRRPLHRRNVDVQGYLRDDGLWEVEAILVDTKAYDIDLIDKGHLPGGEALHHMILTITLNNELEIVDVCANMHASPLQDCPAASQQYAALIGLRIRSGWMDEAKKAIGRVTGCTHLTELLPMLATAAMMTIRGYHLQNTPGFTNGEQERKTMLNSCYGFREDGRAKRLLWPPEA